MKHLVHRNGILEEDDDGNDDNEEEEEENYDNDDIRMRIMLKTCGKSEEALEKNFNTVFESIIKVSRVVVVIVLQHIDGSSFV